MKFTGGIIVALSLAVGPLAGAETEPNIDSLIAVLKPAGLKALRDIEKQLASIAKAKLSDAQRQSRASSVTIAAKTLVSEDRELIGELPFPLKPGAVGVMPLIDVTQVIDDKSLLGDLRYLYKANGMVPALLTGIPTEGVVDGRKVEFKTPMYVAGTRQFETVSGGTRTVFLLKPFDAEALEKAMRDRAVDKEQAKTAKKKVKP